jgi:hypothetical protein
VGGGEEQPLGGLGAPGYLGALLGDWGTARGKLPADRRKPFDARGTRLADRGKPLEDRGKDERTAERQASVSKALMYSCWARRMVCNRVWPR